MYTLPFANSDANIAEALTLLATILILVLGLAQKAKSAEELLGGISEDEDAIMGTFLGNLNFVIYLLMGGMVGASIMIVLRRLRGALFNAQHLTKLDNAENDGRQIPDEGRSRRHKRGGRGAGMGDSDDRSLVGDAAEGTARLGVAVS